MKEKKIMSLLLLQAAFFLVNHPAQSQTQTVLSYSPNPASPPLPTLEVNSTSTDTSMGYTRGILVRSTGGKFNNGIVCYSENSGLINQAIEGWANGSAYSGIGVMGIATNNKIASMGIYGQAYDAEWNNWAGYFDGEITTSGVFIPSDERLKQGVKVEKTVIEKIKLLNPVSYNYKTKELKNTIQLPGNLQHGLIAQELQSVFPEMVKEIYHPVFIKGKFDRHEKITGVNYNMLIPVLIKAVQEQQDHIEKLEEKINALSARISVVADNNPKGMYLGQNIPNPSGYATEISYKIPDGITNASIAVFDLTGKMVLQFNNLRGNNKLTLNKSNLAAGSYIYSLIVNGQEAISKKMIISQ